MLLGRAAFRKAQALFESRSYKEAAEAFEKALRDHPRAESAPDAALALGRTYAEMRDFGRAARAFLDASVKYPGASTDPEADKSLAGLKLLGAEIPRLTADEQYERARNLYRAKEYDKALEAFNRALEADPSHSQRAEIWLRSGVALYYLGRRSEAASSLDRLVKERPADCRCAEAYYWLGKSYSRLGMRDEAVQTYLKMVASYPGSEWADDALYQTGNVYRDAGDMKKASLYYRRLAAEYPGSSFADSAVWWQAWGLYTAGEYEKCREKLQDLIAAYPRSFLVNQALYWQGRAAEKAGDAAKSLAYYQKVLRRGPYTYYGYRAAERLAAFKLPVVIVKDEGTQAGDGSGGPTDEAALPASLTEEEGALEQAAPETVEELVDGEGPPVWTDEAVQTLSSSPAYRKILDLMYVGLRKEAAEELWALQGRVLFRRGPLLGLSKTFFELGDYYRSLIIVLRNFDRHLERPSGKMPEDLWRLAYPQGYWDSIATQARKHGIDPFFIAAIIREESQFLPEALSPAGARGVMQVMPATGEWIARSAGISGFDRSRLFESDTAISVGSWYLGHLMKKFRGDLVLVAAAYNAGPEPVSAWLGKNGGLEPDVFVESIPYLETRGYVKKVLRNYAEYRRIYGRGEGINSKLQIANPK
jgi:soluble lytic murein transglycosylase